MIYKCTQWSAKANSDAQERRDLDGTKFYCLHATSWLLQCLDQEIDTRILFSINGVIYRVIIPPERLLHYTTPV